MKSAFINTVHNAEQRGEALSTKDLAASFQASVVEVLVTKTIRACQEYPVKQLLIAGGVAANQGLREAMRHAISEQLPAVTLHNAEQRGEAPVYKGFSRKFSGEWW